MNITKYILISAVGLGLTANGQPISIPGSQFPIVSHMSNYFRFIGVDTNGGRSVFSNTKSNFTATWDVIVSDMTSTITTSTNVSGSFVTPQQFGAKADGVNDDTAAIQSAIDYVALLNNTPSMVFFPPGVYQVTSTLLIRSNSVTTDTTRKGYSLQGVKSLSQINYTPSSGNCFEFRVFSSLGDNAHLNHFFMKDLYITGVGGTNNTANGVYIGKDMTEDRGADAAGWDDRIEGCQIHKFKRGVVINNIVESKIWLASDIEQNWYASCLFTNADTWQVKDTVLGEPAAGVDHSDPLSFTNLCAIETWLGVGGRVEGCEIGAVSRALYDQSTPITWIGGNTEGCYNEGFYLVGFGANSVFEGFRIASIGDGTTNFPIFRLDAVQDRITINSPNFTVNRLIKEDGVFEGFFQPTVNGLNLPNLAPIQFGPSTYFPWTNNITANIQGHIWSRSVALNTAEMTNQVLVGQGNAPAPSLIGHGVLVASNTVPQVGVTVPYGLGFTQVRSTVSFVGDSLITGINMKLFLSPNTYRFPVSGLVQDNAGQAWPITGITNGVITTFITTNSFANDTDVREMWIKCYGDGGLSTGITNRTWIVNWQIDSIP